jgi:hypothetical protein
MSPFPRSASSSFGVANGCCMTTCSRSTALHGEWALMTYPFFALSKNAWIRPLTYDHAIVLLDRVGIAQAGTEGRDVADRER